MAYSLINNGDTGLSVRTTLNQVLTDANSGTFNGTSGTSGVSGTSGTSGTSGVSGTSGTSGTSAPAGAIVVASGSPNTINDVWSGTQAQYDALSPTYSTTTIYFIEA